MAKKIKNKLKGTETRADIIDKIGGAGGGARRTPKPKAKAKKDTSPSIDEYLSTRPKLAKRAAEGRKDLAKSASKLRALGQDRLKMDTWMKDRMAKKAKKKSPEISRSEKETGVSHAEAERLFGDRLKKSPKNKDFIKRVDKASRERMKKMMKSPDYGKKFTFSKKLKKTMGLE